MRLAVQRKLIGLPQIQSHVFRDIPEHRPSPASCVGYRVAFITDSPSESGEAGELLHLGFALASSPGCCYVDGAASLDDEVVRAVGGEELDQVAVGVDDGAD